MLNHSARLSALAGISLLAMATAGNAQTATPPAAAKGPNTVKTETAQHPRIARAIQDLEDAIKYMEAAPHNFGGHKAKGIADSRAAIAELRQAMAYRAAEANAAGIPPAAKPKPTGQAPAKAQ